MDSGKDAVEGALPQTVAVIGAGTMGAGIAAHLANLGFDVTLLDTTIDRVQEGLARARAARPPQFYVPDISDRIRCGVVSDNLNWAAEADWVCEAIVEDPEAKRALFADLDPLLTGRTIVTTNTSGLQIEMLAEGRGEAFRRSFMGTHFFNPPRYLKLLELIPTPQTDPAVLAKMTSFLEDAVARRVVVAKDTPGFIANRFGMWSMFHAIHTAEMLHLTVEQVDAITGPFLGRPRSASFRLNDMVGLDIMRDIAANIVERCPNDPHLAALTPPKSLTALIQRGWLGDKSGRGYYRKEGSEFLALDLTTFAYRQRTEAKFAALDDLAWKPIGERVRAALELRDEAGEFLRNYLIPALDYADYLKEEISHSVLDFDHVMMWGFGWDAGPFSMLDQIGPRGQSVPRTCFYVDTTYKAFDDRYVPIPKESEYKTLSECPVVEESEGLRVRDAGDGVLAVCLGTKMGTLNPDVVDRFHSLLDGKLLRRFILANDGRNFSAGYNLQFFLDAIGDEAWSKIEEALERIQLLGVRLSQRPCVAAVQGYCLGGGFEIAMSCPVMAAHAEATMGLPEANVGLVPAGGGLANLRMRAQSLGAKGLADAAQTVFTASVSTCAEDARRKGYLRPTDRIVYHPDRLLSEAKRLALEVEPSPPPVLSPAQGPLVGMIDRLKQELKAKGAFSAHDEAIADKVKQVFSKATSFEDALAWERKAFLELCGKALTVARIRHMLSNGKPLRN